MRFALAQINTGRDVAANMAKIREYTSRAAEQEAEVVVFPEASMSAFGTDLKAAVDEEGPAWRESMAELAATTGLIVIVGEFERSGERVVNHLAAYFPDGRCSRYAKIHLYDAFGYRESDSVAAGEELSVLDLGDTRVGMAVCYDIRFPKLFAELSRRGAKVAIVSASWGAGPGKVEQWQILARARALDSNMFVIALGQADPEVSGVDVPAGAPTGVGHSLVADPFGHVIAELDGGESLAIVDIDTELSDRAAEAVPVLENARLGY